MRILLNNREEEFNAEEISVDEMIVLRKFSFRQKIIKINGEFIPKEKYGSAIIHNGDNVQMLYLMSGG